MNTLLPLLQSSTGQSAAAATGDNSLGFLFQLLPILLIVVVFYFLIIRPQNKKQKETQKMLDSLKKGDSVVTIGGIHGVIDYVGDKEVIVKVDDSCKLKFSRAAIASVERGEAPKQVEGKQDK